MAIWVASGPPRTTGATPAPAVDSRRPAAWPLAVLFIGFPLWWALGLASAMPILMAVPMAAQLLRRRTLALPGGFGWWMLFLLWTVLGVAVLWTDAPAAVPGGDVTRLLVFGYRIAWYAACTVVLLWVLNTPRRLMPDLQVVRIVGAMFVVAAAGGLLGLLAPGLEFRSPVELLLPGPLGNNKFVLSLVHPEAADVQFVLGRPETRPKAPFPFTNSWGSALSLALVFFVAALRGASWRRLLLSAAVAAAAVPAIFYSLNRGLWGSLVLGGVGIMALLALRGRLRAVVALSLAGAIVLAALMASPLGGLFTERLDNQHSNNRRSNLLETTVRSVTEGSPVVGFGNTRDLQGSFSSIAGGSTPDCPACGVPPLGTQGHVWLVLFSQGWFGAAFFLVFFVLALARSARCRTLAETVCTFVLVFFVAQLAIYDTLGMPLLMVMVAVGLVARERLENGGRPTPRALLTSAAMARELRRAAPAMLVLALLGGAAGWYVALLRPDPGHAAAVSIAITPSPVHLDVGLAAAAGLSGTRSEPRQITVDTEASLLLSEKTLRQAVSRAGTADTQDLRSRIALTAHPNSQVLELVVRDGNAQRAEQLAHAVADAYLDAREAHLVNRRGELVHQLDQELRQLKGSDGATASTRTLLRSAISHLRSSSASVGEVIRRSDARPVGRQTEVTITSGVALGLLLGVTLTALRRRP